MIIAIDFDDTVVEQDHPYEDLEAPLRLKPGAADGLRALKHAGHTLLLWSARANRALREDPEFNPLVRAGLTRIDRARWERMRPVNIARYNQMVAFVEVELPRIFDAVDDGVQGKPCVDLFIDDRAMRYGAGALGMTWRQIAHTYGEPDYGPPIGSQQRAPPAER